VTRRAPRAVGACAAAALAALCAARARAAEAPPAAGLLLRLGVGPAFVYESWSPEGPNVGSTAYGFGPVVGVTLGAPVKPGLVVAGDLQLGGIINRTEIYLGTSYDLVDTLHFVDTLVALVDWIPPKHPRLHLGVGLGLAAVTNMGGAQTAYGVALPVQAGYERPISPRWAAGVGLRITAYRVFADEPPPPATSTGALFTLLVSFTRR